MKEAFNQLCSEEERVNGELDSILANQVGLETRLRGITKIAPKLGEVAVTRNSSPGYKLFISSFLTFLILISFQPDFLQRHAGRGRVCQGASAGHGQVSYRREQRVHYLIDLKLCSERVKTALMEEDYKCAAGHIHRCQRSCDFYF